jgi:RimJ/RimL family protein N-acetyltransferase
VAQSVVSSTLIAVAGRNRRNRLFLVRYNAQACELVALADTSAADKTAMMWYVLGEEELSGRGINSEAVIQLTRFCLADMRLASVYAWIVEENMASRIVLLESWLYVRPGAFVAQLLVLGARWTVSILI